MNRNERITPIALLKAIHDARETPHLDKEWRISVMNSVESAPNKTPLLSDLERLAPTLAIGATAMAVICLIAATVALDALPDALYYAYGNHIFGIMPMTML